MARRSSPPVVVIRSGGGMGGAASLVGLALLAVGLYYAATQGPKLLQKLSRPALEAVGAAFGIPEDIRESASDSALRALIWSEAKRKAAAGAVLATAALVLRALWQARGVFALAGAGSLLGPVLWLGMGVAGAWAVTKVGQKTGLVPGGDGEGGGADGPVHLELEYEPVPDTSWNTDGSVWA